MRQHPFICILPVLLLVLWLPACVMTSTPAPQAVAPARIWPAPPDEPRIAYVRSITGPADLGVVPSRWRWFFNLLTGLGGDKENLVKPFGLAVDETDNLCLTDTGAGMVSFFDQAAKRYTRWAKSSGVCFVQPVAVARANGRIYVADSGLKKILVCDGRGKLLFDIQAGFQRPSGLAIHGDRLYVADVVAHRIAIFNLAGQPLAQFGRRGASPGEFNCPTHITADRQGRLYVTDSMNGRIQVFDQDGRFQGVIGSSGDTPGHFGRPKGVAVDGFGHVYVADALFDNIQVFDSAGRLLLVWGEAGTEPGEFWLPEGVAISRHDEIYVADSYNQRVQVFKYIGVP